MEVPSEANEITYSWDTSLHEVYGGTMADSISPLNRNGSAENAEDRVLVDTEKHDLKRNLVKCPFGEVVHSGHQPVGIQSSLEMSKSNSKNMVLCRVLLLDNSEHVLEINKKSKGGELFDAVCEHVNIIEKDYFSCSYKDKDDLKVWLDMEKKLYRQIGDGPVHFAFEVKFYPSDPAYLQEDLTRYQLCLQIQRDVSSGRIPCSFVTYALLGSYAVQSELGDYVMEEIRFGTSYIKHLLFAPNQTDELLEKVVELHRTHRGLTPAESDLLYLVNASKLAMYGVELHHAKDSAGDPIMLGVCATGLMMYRERLRINKFIWPRILQISYKRRHFFILVRPNELDVRDANITFKFPTQKIAKRVWRTVVEYHSFFRLREAEPSVQRKFFPWFGCSKFQYSGRTQHQSREVSSQIDRPAPACNRTLSKSFSASVGNYPIPTAARNPYSKNVSVLIETSNSQQNFMTNNGFFNRSEVDRSHQESPISCSSRMTSGSHHLPTTPSQCSSQSESQVVKMQTKTVTYAAPGSCTDDFGMLVSAHSHSSRTHTIETTTYQTERDGVLETHVEKKFLLSADGKEIDQNAAFANVIRSIADVSPSLSVEKIEIHTRTELEGN